MDRYTKVNGSDTPPAAPPAPDHLYPTSGIPGSVPASTPGAWLYHMLVEEMRGVITLAGLTPDFANLTQLAQAVQALGATKPGMMMFWPTPVCPSWALVRDGSAVSRTTYASLFAVMCPTRNMTTTNASKNLSGISDTKDLYIGMPIEGAGIAAGATIETITGASTATMSIVASAGATVPVRLFYYGYGTSGNSTTFGLPDDRGLFVRGLDTTRGYDQTTLTGTTTSGQNTLTGLATTKGMYVGMPLSAVAGIAGGTTVASITSASAITMSANASATGARAVVFTGGQIGNERGDTFQGHWHNYVYLGNGVTGGSGYLGDTTPGGVSPTTVRDAIADQNGSGTPRTGPETRPKFRTALPIISY